MSRPEGKYIGYFRTAVDYPVHVQIQAVDLRHRVLLQVLHAERVASGDPGLGGGRYQEKKRGTPILQINLKGL